MSAPQVTLSAQDREILAMTLAGEIDPRRSPYDDPQTLQEMANILAVAVNRYSTGAPAGFGPAYRSRPDGTRTTERLSDYNSIADVALQAPSANSRNREFGQFSAFNPSHVRTTQANYNARPEYFQNVVDQFFSGQLQASIPDATHYHADWMTAWWADDFDKVGTSGAHHFYSDVNDMQRPLGGTRPAYAQLEFNQPAETDQPNPQGDLNQQELANIAPPIPANARQMAQAKTPNVPNPTARPSWAPAATPVENRTIAGFVGQQMGVSPEQVVAGMVAPGASARARRGVSGLTPETQQRLSEVSSLLPADNQPQITSTVRNDRFRTHAYGGAVDLRNRDSTPFQEAQQVAALARAGFEAIGPYERGALGMINGQPSAPHIHVGDDPRFNRAGSVFQAKARDDNPYLSGTMRADMDTGRRSVQGGLYDAVDFGSPVSDAWFGPTAPTPTQNVQPRNMGDGSLDAVPGITPRPDRRATDFGPLPAETTPRLSDTYTRPASLPQLTYGPQNGRGGVSRPSQQALSGSASDTTARINQGFNDALAPRSMPSPVASVSPQGSFGTPRQRNSPDQFQYATAPTPSPAMRTETRTREVANPAYAAWESTYRGSQQKSPTSFQYVPQGPSRDAMLANYGARALQSSDPFASAPPAPPQTITERYQVSVPNPVARPTGPAPTPRGPQFAGVPNPVVRPSSLPQRRSGIEQAFAGFNDWIGGRAGPIAGSMLGGALGGPIGALVGGLGGYGAQQAMGGNVSLPQVNLVQGTNLPAPGTTTPNWQDTTGLPTYASVTGNSGGTGASAHDAWADSLGSAFY